MLQALRTPNSIPFWTLSRGEQTITCEMVPSSGGHSILRCAYGPQALVRSQFIQSEDAAAAVSEIWKAALQLEGFRAAATPVPVR